MTISVPLQALFVFTGNSTDFLNTLLLLYNTVHLQYTVHFGKPGGHFWFDFYFKINDVYFPSVHFKPSYQVFWPVWLINRIM